MKRDMERTREIKREVMRYMKRERTIEIKT